MAGLPLLNTSLPQHLSSYSWAHLTPSKQQVLLSGDTGSQKTQEARQVVRRQFPNMFY